MLHDWARNKFMFAWSRDLTTLLPLRKTPSTVHFQVLWLLKQYIMHFSRYWADRYKFQQGVGIFSMGMFRDTHFALQESTNRKSKQFVVHKICTELRATVDARIAVSFPTFFPVMWRVNILNRKKGMEDSCQFNGWRRWKFGISWLSQISRSRWWRNVDLFQVPIQTQGHTSLCRVQGRIVWWLDNAAFKILIFFLLCNILSVSTNLKLSIFFFKTHHWETESTRQMNDQRDDINLGKLVFDVSNREGRSWACLG